MKKLGFGFMRLPLLDAADERSIDMKQVNQMVDLFMQRGFTYFDTAYIYHGGLSEAALRTALVDRYPRDSYTIATKLHAISYKIREDAETVFANQLERLGISYIDYYLLHDMTEKFYDKFNSCDLWNWLADKKSAGLVKNMGFSFHDTPEVLDRILTEHPDVDFVQLQINYLDWDSEGILSRQNYEVARRHGKQIIVMEPVKGGILARLPQPAYDELLAVHDDWSQAEWAIKFAADLDGVMMVLSGMSDVAQVEDNTSYMSDFTGLEASEHDAIGRCLDALNNAAIIPCTGCSYCTDGCPKRIPIPKYFSLYNNDNKEKDRKGWTTQREIYKVYAENFAPASECIGCGACEKICPQHLEIPKLMKKVSQYFDEGKMEDVQND